MTVKMTAQSTSSAGTPSSVIPGKIDIVLGSASPRRLELLSRFLPAGSFQVNPVDLDEAALLSELLAEDPQARFGLSSIWAAKIARELAKAKMTALLSDLKSSLNFTDMSKIADLPHLTDSANTTDSAVLVSSSARGLIAVTADTIVVAGDQILGKPRDAEDAKAMLRKLSGRQHAVMTGLCVQAELAGKSEQFTAVEMTQVEFSVLSEAQIDWYAATGEPLDKAGAYGIQGYGSALVKSLSGCYYNVMGLPIHRLLELFSQVYKAFPSSAADLKLLPW